MDHKLRLKGFTLTRESMQERFGAELNDYEWNHFVKVVTDTWENREFELEGVVVKHLRNGLEDLGFKAQLVDGELKFERK